MKRLSGTKMWCKPVLFHLRGAAFVVLLRHVYHKLTDGGGSNFTITSAALYDNEPKSGPSFSWKMVMETENQKERRRRK